MINNPTPNSIAAKVKIKKLKQNKKEFCIIIPTKIVITYIIVQFNSDHNNNWSIVQLFNKNKKKIIQKYKKKISNENDIYIK